jgi:2-dehydropantoate 2-reductase
MNQAIAHTQPPTVGVFGAGAIGAYVGALLSSASIPVVLLGRERLVAQRDSLVAVDRRGDEHRLGPRALVSDDPAALADVDICLVCVKSAATEEAARTLAQVLRRPQTRVISLQNGLRNRERLAQALAQPVSAGVVEFNVAPTGDGRFPQTVPGTLWLEEGDPRVEAIAAALREVGQPTALHGSIADVMRGKLLINAINGVGGATGMATRRLLANRDARWVYARCIREGLAVFRARDEGVARVSGLGPRGLGLLLRLPDLLFRPLLALSSAERGAVTSTVQDLRRGRRTEIDELNGAIVRLAAEVGLDAPINRLVAETVRDHEVAAVAGASPGYCTPGALRLAGERRLLTHRRREATSRRLEPASRTVPPALPARAAPQHREVY